MAENLGKIARAAGVAVSTVSRALSGKPGVSQAKREKIVALARRSGYVPDPEASGLRTGRGSGLAVLTPPKLSGIASMRNYALFSYGRERLGQTRVVVGTDLEVAVRQALSQKCRAIVAHVVSGNLGEDVLTNLRRRQVPFAMVDGSCNWGDHFLIDRSAGTYQAARLLLLNGCRHIFVFSNAPLENPDPRLEGIVRGFASLGVELFPKQIVPVRAGFEGGYEAMGSLLKAEVIDGAFCYSDETAMGAMRALSEAGVKVPDEVQVVGFDNVAFAEYGPIPLTTAAQPLEDIARAAVDSCVRRAELWRAEHETYSFSTQLIVRASAPIRRHELRIEVFRRPDESDSGPGGEEAT